MKFSAASINTHNLNTGVNGNQDGAYSPISPTLNRNKSGFLFSKDRRNPMEEITTRIVENFPVISSPESNDLQTTEFPVQKIEVCSIDDIPNWKIKEISITNGVIKAMDNLDLNNCTFRLLWDFSDLYQVAASLGKSIDPINGGNEFAEVPFFCLTDGIGFKENNVFLFRVLDRACFMDFFMQLSFWTNMGREGILERYTVERQVEAVGSVEATFVSLKCRCLFESEGLKSSGHWLDCHISSSDGFLTLKFSFEDSSLDFVIDIRDILDAEIKPLDPSLCQNGEKLLNISLLPELRNHYRLKDLDWFEENHIPSNITVKFTTLFNFLKVFFLLKKNCMKEVLADHINKLNHLRLNQSINLNIIEAELNNMSLYSSPIYIEVCVHDKVFAKTNKVESTYGQLFWREEFALKASFYLNSIVLKLKLENNNTVVGYVDIGNYYIYNNDFKAAGKELKLPILQHLSSKTNSNKVIGELLVTLKHEWNFVLPSVQYYAIMDIFKQIKMDYLVHYIYKDNKINNDTIVFEIGKTIFNILSFYGRENHYLQQCIEKEINDTIEVLILRSSIKSGSEAPSDNHVFNSLFRGNSLVTKMLESHFNKLGCEYLFQIFQPILKKIYDDNLNLEMDPKKLRRNVKDLKNDDQLNEILNNNYEKICEYLNDIWNSIYTTSMDLPQNIKLQLKFIRTNLELFSVHGLGEEQLNQLVTNCISSFIFLRFFIPIILNPKLFNIMGNSPNETQRRTLTLISKILLNISTQTIFEIKDPFLSKFNSFIKSKKVDVSNYYDRITEKALDFTPKKYDFLVWKNDDSLINKFENDSIELQCTRFIDFVVENDLNSKNFINESKFLYDVKSLTYKKDIIIEMPKILQTRDLLNSPMDQMSDFTFSKTLNKNQTQNKYSIGELSFENELNGDEKVDFGENMFKLLGLKDSSDKEPEPKISNSDYNKKPKHYSFEKNILNADLTQLFSECHILYSKKIRILQGFQQKEIYKKKLKDFVSFELLPNLVYDLNTKVVSMRDQALVSKLNRKEIRLVFQTPSMTELILGSYVLYGKLRENNISETEINKSKQSKLLKQTKNNNHTGVLSRSFSRLFGKK